MRAENPLAIKRKLRCAIYTRKSTEEGLEKEFNSLDAQREACEAYALSQKAEGWHLVHDRYDDGGFSGGTLERPALKRLMVDIEVGRVDIILVYKIDRLSRSLMDFAKLVEVFDQRNVTFVSVTQSFNTTTSMGRLTLNVLLSFAQFEREVIGERIRDKFAASRKKGMWMGGYVPLGYRVQDRKLLINEDEAPIVRIIFDRFVKLGSGTKLVRELATQNIRNRKGRLIEKGVIYNILNNRVYIGDAVHKGTAYLGEHSPVIDRELWDKAHAILKISPHKRASETRARTPALLKGLIFGPGGVTMTPTHTRKKGKLYRYYIAAPELRSGVPSNSPVKRIPAAEIEAAVVDQIRLMARSSEIIVATWQAAKAQVKGLTERQVREYLHRFSELWAELFPAEQARVVQLLVERVEVGSNGADITLRTDGLTSLVLDLTPRQRNGQGGSMKSKVGTIIVHVPLKLAARGGRKLIIVDGSNTEAAIADPPSENPVVKSLALAFRWKKMLERNQYSSIPDLAKAEKVNAMYVYRMLRLTLLAPTLVDRILNGEMRCSISKILKPLPILWSDQYLPDAALAS